MPTAESRQPVSVGELLIRHRTLATIVGVIIVIAAVVFGEFALIPIAVVAIFVLGHQRAPRAVPWLLAAVAAFPLYEGWLHRGGPGRSCSIELAVLVCKHTSSPVPWFATAAVLLALAAGYAYWNSSRATA